MARKPIPDTAALPVDVAAWLDELARTGRKSDVGYTARELAEAAGVSVERMRFRIAKGLAAGRLALGTATRQRIDSRPTTVPVYRVVKAPAARGR